MRLHLTDLTVRGLKEQGYYWDTQLPAFGIRVGKTRKSWTVVHGRGRDRVTLGQYPAMSLADARLAAKRLLIEPPVRHAAITFPDARSAFIETHYRDKGARTKAEAKRLLEKHFRFDGPLTGLTDSMIGSALDAIAKESERLHAFRALRTMLRWATRPPRRYLTHSPMEGYAPPSKEKVGDRVLSDDEIAALWRATADLSIFSRITRLLLLTGARRSMIGGLRHEWITPDGILFPPTAMKGRREFLLPLTPLAASLIPPGFGYVFPARGRDTPFAGYSASTAALVKRSGVDFHIHALRRTAATNWGRWAQPHVIQALLAHQWGGVTARYNRFDYLEEKRSCLIRWEERVHDIAAR